MFRLCSLLGLLALASGEESFEELEADKPELLKVASDNQRPQDGLELRLLQRHGRAPLPQHLLGKEDEDFDEVIVEYKTNLYVSSIELRLPEKQEQSANVFDGYKFLTGPNNDCKFQLEDKSVLPSNDTQVARDLAGSGEIGYCVADNDDAGDMKPRRSSAMLKFHLHPFEHNASGWRYFSIMIRNAQKTPVRSSINGQEANTFQIVVKTPWETIAEMSFEALQIQAVWVCSYTPWFVTTPCTADCGGGFRTRVRRKLHANPEGYNPKVLKSCHEKIEEHESCNIQECDVDCQLSEWTPWAKGECSRSCGGGTMVERRNVVMGPKGNGQICPPWSAEGERVRVVPCNPEPCPASCSESPLLAEYQEVAKDVSSKLLVFKDLPAPGVKAIEAESEEESESENEETDKEPEAKATKEQATEAKETKPTAEKETEATQDETKPKEISAPSMPSKELAGTKEMGPSGIPKTQKAKEVGTEEQETKASKDETPNEETDSETKEAKSTNHNTDQGNTAQESDQDGNIGEGEDESKVDDDTPQSLLSTRETPATLGLSKSSCSEPCGGGRRLVLLPSEQKVASAKEDKSCYTAFEEECNIFACQPLMIQPATAWQFPVAGKWFLVDVSFVIEELAESVTLRAPPDFLLGATTDESAECFLAEHSLPNLENCTVYPGHTSDKTGPIIVLDFSNPLEPQNSYTSKRDWYYMRFWVQHPENCTGGETSDGRCQGLVGERQWTLSLKMSEPSSLWEVVKGSYEIFVDEKSAKAAFEANAASNRPFTDDAQEVEPDTVKGESGESKSKDGEGPKSPKGDEKASKGEEDSLMEDHEVHHHRGHRHHSKARWRS